VTALRLRAPDLVSRYLDIAERIMFDAGGDISGAGFSLHVHPTEMVVQT
jgi:hypothetical protein